MDIADICIALYLHYLRLHYYASPPIKTSICNNTHSYRGTHSAVTPLIFSLIVSTLGAIAATAFASTEYIKVYSVIAVSICVDIVYK